MIKGCIVLILSILLACVLLFLSIYNPSYSKEISFLIVAVLMTVIIAQSEASIIAKLLAWGIVWVATFYVIIF